jgi:hypothetical protein
MSDRVFFKLADGTEIYINVPLLVPQLEADESADTVQLHNVNSFFQTICDLPKIGEEWHKLSTMEVLTGGSEKIDWSRVRQAIDRLTSKAGKTKSEGLANDIQILANDMQILSSIRELLLKASPEVQSAFKDVLCTTTKTISKKLPEGISYP